VRRGVGRGDTRQPGWWYDECGEGMGTQNETLPATTTWAADFLLRQAPTAEIQNLKHQKRKRARKHKAEEVAAGGVGREDQDRHARTRP
jgi:hypothetical protein